MAYTPNTWATGDIITATKLNNMEQGIANAGGALQVGYTFDDGVITLDKTWQEVHDGLAAGSAFIVVFDPDDFDGWSWGEQVGVIISVYSYGAGDYGVRVGDHALTAASPTDYLKYYFGD